VSGNLRKVKAFWNILTDNNKPVSVIGWWASWPAEKISGVLIADLFPFRDTLQQTCFPVTMQPHLEQISDNCSRELDTILARDFSIVPDEISLYNEGERGLTTVSDQSNIGLFRRDFKYDLEKIHYFNLLAAQQKSSQIALFLNSTDIASHLFYRCTAPAHENGNWSTDSELDSRFNRVIEQAYRYAETPLHSMLEQMSDLVHICIVSDHGFTFVPYTVTVSWNIVLSELGLLSYLPENNDQKFRSIDWDRTLAYYDPRKPRQYLAITMNPDFVATNQQHQYSNHDLHQREAIVLKNMASVRLADGRPLFSFIGKDNASGELLFEPRTEFLDNTATLLVGNKEFPASNLLQGPRLSGGHRKEGIILLWGAGFKQGHRLTTSTTYDVTPTLLWVNNLPLSHDFKGSVPVEAMKPNALSRRPPQLIESYGPRQLHEFQTAMSESVDDQIKTKLKALGYIN